MAISPNTIWTSSQLPALSPVGIKLLEFSQKPSTAPQELEALLRSHPVLCGNFIAAANSPLTSLSAPVLTIDQALMTLGVTNAISLNLTLQLVDLYQAAIPKAAIPGQNATTNQGANPLQPGSAQPPGNATATNSSSLPGIQTGAGIQAGVDEKFVRLHANRAWRRAVAKAIAAEILCQHVRDGLESEYFLAGLTLDVGRLAVLQTVPHAFTSILELTQTTNLNRWESEERELGLTTAELGGQLLRRWGFPTRLIRGVQGQNASVKSFKNRDGHSDCSLSRALACASAIGDYLFDDQQGSTRFRFEELMQEVIPLSDRELESLLHTIAQRYEVVNAVLAPQQSTSSSTAIVRGTASGEVKSKDPLSASDLGSSADLPHRATDAMTSLPENNPLSQVRSALPLPSELERRGQGADANRIEAKSNLDPLTKVLHRSHFDVVLQQEVQRCCQSAAPVGIAIVEVDRFEKIKDRFGPEAADTVLVQISGILNELLRTSDAIARSDRQFLIMASNPTAKGMQKLSDRIRSRVDGERLVWSGESIPLTVSVGASLALPGRQDLDIGKKVIATAQKATREAAFGEGNNIYFSSLVDEVELHRLFMANQMRFSRWLVSRGILDIPRVAKALLGFQQRPLKMGDLAIRQELLSQAEVKHVLSEQAASNARFGDIAVRKTYLTEEQLTGLLILQQEDPILVASLFMKRSLLEPQQLTSLLREYFTVVPWAAPLNPTAGRG